MVFGRKQRVLVIDDEADLRETIDLRFSTAGFEVHGAPDGEEGLRLAARLRPAAIILDVNMPGIDGFETCRRLRASRRTRDIPVIMLTACKRVGELEEGLEAGADTYLTKPFDGAELVDEVREIVAGKKKSESTRKLRKAGTSATEAAIEKLRAAPRRLGEVARAVPGLLLGRRDQRLLSAERESDRHRAILFEDDIKPLVPLRPTCYLRFSEDLARALCPDAAVFDAPKKVLVRRTAPPLVAALDAQKRLVDKAVICVVPRARGTKPEFLLGVLASRVTGFALSAVVERTRGGLLPWVSPAELESLPLPGSRGLAGRDYEEKVAALAADLVRRAGLGSAGGSGPDSRLLERLDRAVAEGFGLSSDQLKNLVS